MLATCPLPSPTKREGDIPSPLAGEGKGEGEEREFSKVSIINNVVLDHQVFSETAISGVTS